MDRVDHSRDRFLMGAWWRGFLAGAAVALAAAALLAGGTQFEAFVRVAGGGRYLFDARLDESAVGRIVNPAVGMLGEAAWRKRNWVVVTTYEFTLRIRPEAAPALGRALQDIQVTVRLPGRVRATNADRTDGGVAAWDTLPPQPLVARTVAIHWFRIALIAAAAIAAFGAGRRS